MPEDESPTADPFGTKAIGETAKILAQAFADCGAFLARICEPVAKEFSLMWADRIHFYRIRNMIREIQKAEQMLNQYPEAEKWQAHPRLVAATLEHGSWTDDEAVQEMWAGLLASSCTEDGRDESNLIFINLLSQLTSAQALILNHSCMKAEKKADKAGWIYAEDLEMTLGELQELTGISDLYRLDRELDYLRSIELIRHGFDFNSTTANVAPTGLALQMYVRCKGSTGSPLEYFSLERPNSQSPS